MLNLLLPTSAEIIPLWLDLWAVIVGGISGALIGCEKKLDMVGVLACALLTGLGGGLIRDTIMQAGSVYFITSPYAIPAVLIAGIFTFYFHGLLFRIPQTVEWIDILSVALFVVVGTDKAIAYSLSFVATVFMGFITGVGGGMLRDVFIGNTPKIFQQSNFYAICAVFGALIFSILTFATNLPSSVIVVLTILGVVLLRRLSLRFNLQSPADRDLSHHVVKHLKRKV